MSHSNTQPPRLAERHISGLDGLRAIAVIAVVLYHSIPSALPGGFLGVDVFFVISGFLITSLLLRERHARGKIALGNFWIRRARRLIPALVFVVLACSAVAAIIGGDLLVGLGRQVVGTATFSTNWIAIIFSSSYFDQTAPELFRNFWSLAVEEQFYLVWPLVLIACMYFGRRVFVIVCAVLTMVSLTLMAILFAPGSDPTRVYFGTDTHAFGLTFGAMIAVGLWHVRPAALPAKLRRLAFWSATVGVAGIVALSATASEYSSATYPGMLLLAVLASTGAIVGGAFSPAAGRMLDNPVLRWIGERSYGIYLWHWPVLMIALALTPSVQRTGVPRVIVGLVVIAVTLVAAWASYRWLEQPVRKRGFRHQWRALIAAVRQGPRRKAKAALALTLACSTVALTAWGIAVDPGETTSQSAIAQGQQALATESPKPSATPTPTAAPTPTAGWIPPSLPTGSEITAVGESVMLASADELQTAFPGIQVDAEVSRSFAAGLQIVQNLANAGQLRDVVIVGLATNGPISQSDMDALIATVGDDRLLVLVNAFADRPWISGANQTLTDATARHSNVAVAHWNELITPQISLLAGDQIHPGPEGSAVYVRSVDDALLPLTYWRAGYKMPDGVALQSP